MDLPLELPDDNYDPEFPELTKWSYIDEYRLQHYHTRVDQSPGWYDVHFVTPWYHTTHSEEQVEEKRQRYLAFTSYGLDRSKIPLRVIKKRIFTLEQAGREINNVQVPSE